MILLMSATVRELKAALGFLADPPDLVPGGELVFDLAGRQVAAAVTGVGVVNAAFALGRLLALPGVEGVVNVGVAGAFDPRAFGLGTPCVATREVWPEYGLAGTQGVDARQLGFALADIAGEPVWDSLDLDPAAAARRMDLWLSPHLPRAVGLTVSAVSGTAERAEELAGRYGADMESMEGFALAYGCALAKTPFLEIRTISNRVGSRRAEDWDLDKALNMLGPVCAALFMNH